MSYCLHFLLQKYDGRFVNVVKSCDGSAVKLVKRVVEDFPTFRDETEYEGQKGEECLLCCLSVISWTSE